MVSLLLVSACSPSLHAGKAQTYACVAPNSPNALALQDFAVRLTGGDSTLNTTRQAYQLPTVAPSEVQIVKTESICRQAAQAYHKAVRGNSAPQVPRSVAVIKVGTTRYLVLDPAEREGEFEVTVIFDSAFAPLVSFNS